MKVISLSTIHWRKFKNDMLKYRPTKPYRSTKQLGSHRPIKPSCHRNCTGTARLASIGYTGYRAYRNNYDETFELSGIFGSWS